ncbi:glucoamylase [Flagelloscypha sp. PMI_526]|nr:glucoamylase [Flagelloscypha sp. PMI_526]
MITDAYKIAWSASWTTNLTLPSIPLSKMRLQAAFVSLLPFVASVFSQNLDDYIAKERPAAKAGLLANIGPDGAKASGAAPGIVIASPSTENPNYLFTWVRDSSLVFKHLIDEFTTGQDDSLRPTIDEFIRAYTGLQNFDNPSGKAGTSGLGEPKFEIDGTAFTGPWGRPQRDGPALRATAFISYANWLVDNNNGSWVEDTLWPTISKDLNYVVNYWNETGFDLWEEVSSSSFFTTAVQHRVLRQGSTLANKIGKTQNVSSYDEQAGNVLCFLQSYWNANSGYITSNTGGGRSGIDANSGLGSIHTYDPDAGCDDTTFQPCSAKALSSLKVYVDSFRDIYGINSGKAANEAVATGRYKEDVYFNGNPWYLTTTLVAEQLYKALYVWNKQASLEVTDVSKAFFQQFSSTIATGTYASGSDEYKTLTAAIKTFADGFLEIVAKYTPDNGAIAEQFGKDDGVPLSAADLTWSYAAALTAFAARDNVVYPGWGAKDLTPPSVCATHTAPRITANFNVVAETVFGQNIYLVGNVDGLSNWDPSKGIAMNSDSYPTWTASAQVPPDFTIEYKYIKKDGSGAVTWASDPNYSFLAPSEGEDYTTHDTWR